MLGHCDPKHFHIYLSVNALLFNSPEVLQHTGESNMRPQARRSRPRHHFRSEMFNSQATGGSRWRRWRRWRRRQDLLTCAPFCCDLRPAVISRLVFRSSALGLRLWREECLTPPHPQPPQSLTQSSVAHMHLTSCHSQDVLTHMPTQRDPTSCWPIWCLRCWHQNRLPSCPCRSPSQPLFRNPCFKYNCFRYVCTVYFFTFFSSFVKC